MHYTDLLSYITQNAHSKLCACETTFAYLCKLFIISFLYTVQRKLFYFQHACNIFLSIFTRMVKNHSTSIKIKNCCIERPIFHKAAENNTIVTQRATLISFLVLEFTFLIFDNQVQITVLKLTLFCNHRNRHFSQLDFRVSQPLQFYLYSVSI